MDWYARPTSFTRPLKFTSSQLVTRPFQTPLPHQHQSTERTAPPPAGGRWRPRRRPCRSPWSRRRRCASWLACALVWCWNRRRRACACCVSGTATLAMHDMEVSAFDRSINRSIDQSERHQHGSRHGCKGNHRDAWERARAAAVHATRALTDRTRRPPRFIPCRLTMGRQTDNAPTDCPGGGAGDDASMSTFFVWEIGSIENKSRHRSSGRSIFSHKYSPFFLSLLCSWLLFFFG